MMATSRQKSQLRGDTARSPWDRWSIGYLAAGLIWQGYIAVSLISLELQTFHAPFYPGVVLFAGWSLLPATVAALAAGFFPGRQGFWRRFARWFFWLGLPVTAGSIFLTV
jgi:hypothetical protein